MPHYPFSGAFCKGPPGLGLARDIPPIRSAPRPRASRSSSDPPILTRPQRHALAESVIFLSVPFASSSPLALLNPSSSHIDSLHSTHRQHTEYIYLCSLRQHPAFYFFQSRHSHPSPVPDSQWPSIRNCTRRSNLREA